MNEFVTCTVGCNYKPAHRALLGATRAVHAIQAQAMQPQDVKLQQIETAISMA
ncbi:hypothetical protein [Comamonas sp. A7-5]|uniref:hypothetical protein n=1 Tax=Comamonas sp. A7-5 TaxID=673549 RepID=UPI0031DA46A8